MKDTISSVKKLMAYLLQSDVEESPWFYLAVSVVVSTAVGIVVMLIRLL